MPPQQLQRLLDGVDALDGLGTHACSSEIALGKARARREPDWM
jgi:hypothetical protein